MLYSLLAIVIGLSPIVDGLEDLKTKWDAFVDPLVIPKVLDMRDGGHLDLQIGQGNHTWSIAQDIYGPVYGYGLLNGSVSTPGPTILVKKGTPISVTWYNQLNTPHLLDDSIEKTLTIKESACFPYCGIPAVVHVHGLESPAKYDGLPSRSIYANQSRDAIYLNNQSGSTKTYHDHAMGLTRLNIWAGLIGMYIIDDNATEKRFNINVATDIPFVLQDKLISNEGKLLYSDDSCAVPGTTKWIPEAFGSVNVVNGVVMPYVNVPSEQVRFRFVNAANARHYNLTVPFADKCVIIATDSGLVQNTNTLEGNFIMYPFERIEVICDFTSFKNNTQFNVTDTSDVEQSTPYDERLFQIRVVDTLKTGKPFKKIPDTLTKYKDLKALWKETSGKQRSVTLGEMEDANQCPSESLILYRQQQINATTIKSTLTCTKGKVEKWNFKNPTDDPHPFHWHLVNAQCGPSDNEIATNGLKDIVVIPNAGDRPPETVTQICYVACTPDEFLIEGSTRGARDYGFDTSEPYVAHCHILEHEENAMMAWFKITDEDDDTPNDDGTVVDPNMVTPEVIATALGMSILGGLATCFSVVVISVPRLQFLASSRSLSIAFALSAGVMIFLAFADLFPESINFYRAAFSTGGEVDPEAYERGGAAASAAICDTTCGGHAWLATTIAFYAGVCVILLVEFIVHRYFEKHGQINGQEGGDDKKQELIDEEKEIAVSQVEQGQSPLSHLNSRSLLQSPITEETSSLVEVITEKKEYERAGIMTGVAIAIHNFPEGLALFVSSLQGLRTGMVLAIGIILHNLPEGAAIAAPVYYATGSKCEAFKWTLLSGIAQPLGALIGWAAVSGGLTPALQASLFAGVGGMLMCITTKELLPGAFKFDPDGKYFTLSIFVGTGIIAFSLILIHYAGSG
jgi:FtsP/CotA-like multicopper oxidase with cupredoxin domain/zinc transporter ZupT